MCASAIGQCGLIPTHAGKTRRFIGTALKRRAHPHSRGENLHLQPHAGAPAGSSPLTRGKPTGEAPPTASRGLIPTHAGKTHPGRPPRGWRGAHPHSRGENVAGGSWRRRPAGSSPLTRGKLRQAQVLQGGRGLIPTHAGKTRSTPAPGTGTRAHPHSRGENRAEIADLQTRAGSSPLTRGKPNVRPVERVGGRLIPTHAGKTSERTEYLKRGRAHPHSRGENHSPRELALHTAGSSPLTRGKRQPARLHVRVGGLIPTHAGKTASAPPSAWTTWAHPHSRGENWRRRWA